MASFVTFSDSWTEFNLSWGGTVRSVGRSIGRFRIAGGSVPLLDQTLTNLLRTHSTRRALVRDLRRDGWLWAGSGRTDGRTGKRLNKSSGQAAEGDCSDTSIKGYQRWSNLLHRLLAMFAVQVPSLSLTKSGTSTPTFTH